MNAAHPFIALEAENRVPIDCQDSAIAIPFLGILAEDDGDCYAPLATAGPFS